MAGPNDRPPRVLLIGSDTVHMVTFANLIQPACEAVLLVSNGVKNVGELKPVLVDFGLRNPFATLRSIRRLRQTFLQFKPNIVHVHQANTVAFVTILALKKLNVPIVLTTWGSDVLTLPKKNKIAKAMVQYNLRHANKITADANYMAEAITDLANDKTVVVTTFGIDVPENVGTKQNIIFSNRLHKPLYNIDRIVKNFAEFVKVNQEWKLVVAAEGPDSTGLQALASDLGLNDKVEFKGWLKGSENREWYEKAKVFASVPSSDGTSVSLLEAMGFGCVPVVSDLPANREWITDGVNGLVASSEENIFSRLDSVDFNVASAMNREIIKSRASRESSRQTFLNIYHELLQKL